MSGSNGNGEEKKRKDLKDYAAAILVAMPIIFGVTKIGSTADASSAANKNSGMVSFAANTSLIAGLLGILFIILWLTGESSWEIKINGRKEPGPLYLASWIFGIQLGLLIASYLLTWMSTYYAGIIGGCIVILLCLVVFFEKRARKNAEAKSKH